MRNSLRAARKAATRQRLIDHGIRLFLEQGYAETTVEEVSDAAEVSPRTFFRYFHTKQDLVFSHEPEQRTALREAIRRHTPDSIGLAAMRDALVDFAGSLEADADRVRRRLRVIGQDRGLQSEALMRIRGWEDLVRDELTTLSGRGQPTLAIDVLASAAVATVRHAVNAWLTGDRGSLPVALDDALDAFGRVC